MKDIERADFETLLGNNFSEFNFGGEADLDFHSNYDSGNLFSAIKGNDGVYYLEMMPDTNSVGHFKWFHFTVSRTEKGKHQTFRIMNFRKPDLLAKCVYYKSKKDDKKKETGWQPLNSKCSYFSNSENPDVPCLDPADRRAGARQVQAAPHARVLLRVRVQRRPGLFRADRAVHLRRPEPGLARLGALREKREALVRSW